MIMRRKNAAIWNIFTLIILALFLMFVVYPLILILYKSVINPADNSLTFENFTRFFSRKYYTNLIYDGISEYIYAAEGETSIYDTVLAYYEFIRVKNDYAYDAFNNPIMELWAHSVVGAFRDQHFVCEGYSKLFQMLLNYSGIEEIYITGGSIAGEHAWNVVRMDDGDWYWFDATWNDRSNDQPKDFTFFCCKPMRRSPLTAICFRSTCRFPSAPTWNSTAKTSSQ